MYQEVKLKLVVDEDTYIQRAGEDVDFEFKQTHTKMIVVQLQHMTITLKAWTII